MVNEKSPESPASDEESIGEFPKESFARAWAELKEELQGFRKGTPTSLPLHEEQLQKYIPYLLLLWSSFTIYQIEPDVSDEEGGGEGAPEIKQLSSGRVIADYGSRLITSPGESYTTSATGSLLEAVQDMVTTLASRGATQVGFYGHEIAQRAAWIYCLESNITVMGYEPTNADQKVRDRIAKHRKEAQQRVEEAISRPRLV